MKVLFAGMKLVIFSPSSWGRWAAPEIKERTLLKSAFSMPEWLTIWCTTEGISVRVVTLYLLKRKSKGVSHKKKQLRKRKK
jgi:hypothetical protein